MARLSLPTAEIKPHYPVVVVGSGYGGAIAASRLSRAGQKVCVLERGREFQPGEFPDTAGKAIPEMQWDFPSCHIGARTGLYDFRINDDIKVFVGCGLGGGSLVNANVSLPPKNHVFQDRWPKELQPHGAGLAEWFARAEKMLEPKEYPDGFPVLQKLKALKRSADQLSAPFGLLPITVTFQDRVNPVGVRQHACKLCGDCISGCNHHAKNTLTMNYLPDARCHEAEIYTQVAVRYLERRGDKRWSVYYQVLDSGRERFDAPTMVLVADLVILAAGTLGSTEILLRSREKGLPLSDTLGCGFSGNGDFLGLGYNGEEPIHGVGSCHRGGEEPVVGPSTAGMIDLLENPAGILIEEGTIPGAISGFFAAGLAVAATVVGEAPERGLEAFIREKGRRLQSCLPATHRGALRNTMTYLVMGYDDANGHMELEDDRLRVHWPGAANQRVFKGAQELVRKANTSFRGTYLDDTSHLMTVHPLGGCCMADDVKRGVVNHEGQVFSGLTAEPPYENLYVCDGSVIPRAVGVNPFLTICALAERTCDLLAKRRGWQINYAFPRR